MAFFTDKFLNDRREELLRSVDRFQYQLNGGAWQTGTVNSKEIIGTNVVVFVNVPNFGQADTITGVRVYDINGALAGQQSISLKRTSLNSRWRLEQWRRRRGVQFRPGPPALQCQRRHRGPFLFLRITVHCALKH